VLLAFASQLGDIAESAIKRRTGVKDSSNILPGHGGVLDRFDGLIGAVTLLILWGFALPVPQFGG
ncbi:MAG: phosphatidate cytidylyltransferase, partial [Paracoccaceae bacterium]|nr:phosphatidate cytidylyltransferase [Paracoccaceae bacterium]